MNKMSYATWNWSRHIIILQGHVPQVNEEANLDGNALFKLVIILVQPM